MTSFQSLISKKNIVYRREPKTKKNLEGEIFKSFFRDTFSHILTDSNSMYVYVLTTCSMIFLNVKTEHSKIIYLDSCSLLDEVWYFFCNFGDIDKFLVYSKNLKITIRGKGTINLFFGYSLRCSRKMGGKKISLFLLLNFNFIFKSFQSLCST